MLSLQTNVDSLIAQQNLRVNNDFQSKTIQQLTSGYRINSSGDDAAGLAVANGYRSTVAELTQGVRNANDGVSELQIVDGGLSNISQILDRLQTLATESASATFTGDRGTLNAEYQSLLTEIDRQANNIGLGTTNGSNATALSVFIGGGQGSNSDSGVTVDLTGHTVGVQGLGLAGTSVLSTAAVTLGPASPTVIPAGEIDTFTVATATAGVQTITIKGQAGDTTQSQLNYLNTQLGALGISAKFDPSTGALQFQSQIAFSVSASTSGAAADLVDPQNAGADQDMAVNTGLNNLSYVPAAGDSLTITQGTTSATFSPNAPPTQADVVGINAALAAKGISGVTAVLDQSTANGISLQGSATFSASKTNAGVTTNLPAPTQAQQSGDATSAINAILQAVKNLGQTSGIVGAGENTLNYAINLAQSQIASFSSAQSQIRDADVAAQAANLTKAQVLQQANIAAMAQANAEPQAVLALLKQ